MDLEMEKERNMMKMEKQYLMVNTIMEYQRLLWLRLGQE